jgi:hypothetical protein
MELCQELLGMQLCQELQELIQPSYSAAGRSGSTGMKLSSEGCSQTLITWSSLAKSQHALGPAGSHDRILPLLPSGETHSTCNLA